MIVHHDIVQSLLITCGVSEYMHDTIRKMYMCTDVLSFSDRTLHDCTLHPAFTGKTVQQKRRIVHWEPQYLLAQQSFVRS